MNRLKFINLVHLFVRINFKANLAFSAKFTLLDDEIAESETKGFSDFIINLMKKTQGLCISVLCVSLQMLFSGTI